MKTLLSFLLVFICALFSQSALSAEKYTVVIAPLKPGSYTFFDDFHLSHPKGEIIAKE